MTALVRAAWDRLTESYRCFIRGFKEIWTGNACQLVGQLSIECQRCPHRQAVLDYFKK